jgi:hypothetical protein
MTIILKPEQERLLIEAINSGLAHTADEALDRALDALRQWLARPPASSGQPDADRARAFETWARNHPKRPPLPESAFQRENMVRDNG